MNNPLLQGMMNPNLKQMLQAVRAARNPQAMLNQMMMNNPQYQQVMNYIQQNGGDPQAAFYKMAQERGVNPDDILSQLR